MTPRRYYLLKMHVASAACEGGLAAAWRSKRDEQPGTPLPADALTPSLEAADYVAVEDLEGACVDELVREGVPHGEAEAVLAFIASLTPTP